MTIPEQRDMRAKEFVGFQVDHRNRVWVCVDGACVLRVVGAKGVEITDLREDSKLHKKLTRQSVKESSDDGD